MHGYGTQTRTHDFESVNLNIIIYLTDIGERGTKHPIAGASSARGVGLFFSRNPDVPPR